MFCHDCLLRVLLQHNCSAVNGRVIYKLFGVCMSTDLDGYGEKLKFDYGYFLEILS